MNHQIEQVLLDNGASMVGFAKISGFYEKEPRVKCPGEKCKTESLEVPQYPFGVAIAVAYPPEVVRSIITSPTMEYYHAYERLNDQLDELAVTCAGYIKEKGYKAYAQTGSATEEFGVLRTVMPHKTVAVHAGLGWIGKSSLFLTQEYGSAVRLTSVLTDAPIDYYQSEIYSKCGGCMICINACPGKAISGREWEPGLDRDELFDALACQKKSKEIASRSINKEETLCGKCIEVCPYTKKYTDAI